MAHPSFTAPTDLPSPRVTPRGVATYRDLIAKNEQKLLDLRRNRDELLEELSSLDAVIGDVHDTNERYRMKVLSAEGPADYISRMPIPQPGEPALSLLTDDRQHDSGFFSRPSTAVMPAVPGDAEVGTCRNCHKPLWNSTDGGVIHGWGNAECDSADPDTKVAELADNADGGT